LDCRPHLLSSLSKMDDVTTSNTFSKGYGWKPTHLIAGLWFHNIGAACYTGNSQDQLL
jgi:hypothetical protein